MPRMAAPLCHRLTLSLKNPATPASNRTEDIGRGGTLVTRCAWAGAALVSHQNGAELFSSSSTRPVKLAMCGGTPMNGRGGGSDAWDWRSAGSTADFRLSSLRRRAHIYPAILSIEELND